ncbi:MAG TPA: hypothetical protein PKU96_06080 [bacterium]|nr:hypothetical protein [bacterium]HQC50494.1 hypothetical protein [bacterium]HQH80096.1 hypothetical protein [bacterium]
MMLSAIVPQFIGPSLDPLGASLIGNQLLLASRAVMPASLDQYEASASAMYQIAERGGFQRVFYEAKIFSEDPAEKFLISRELFLKAAQQYFGSSLLSIASQTIPYDHFKSHNLLSRSIDYRDIVKCGLLTFMDAEDGLAAVESDLRAMFSDLIGRRHSKRALMKRSAIYKVSQLSFVALAAAVFSGSPLAILSAGILVAAGFGVNELRMIYKTSQEFSFDLAVSRNYQASVVELLSDYMYVRSQRRGLAKAFGYFR